MDFLRSFHFTRARWQQGSEDTTTIFWYKAADGSKAFPAEHAFGSTVWEGTHAGPWEGPGEVDRERTWWKGRPPPGPGDHTPPNLDWFRHGVPASELAPDKPAVLCQGAALVADGGVELDGAATLSQVPPFQASGGVALDDGASFGGGPGLGASGGVALWGWAAFYLGQLLGASGGEELDSTENVFMPGDVLAPLNNAPVAIAGATALTATAFETLHVVTPAVGGFNVTLPAPAGNGRRIIGFRTDPGTTGTWNLKPNAAELIDGSNTPRVLWTGETVLLLCDGTNWFKLDGKTRPFVCQITLAAPQAGIVTGVLTKILVNTALIDVSNQMADLANNRIVIKRTGVYRVGVKVKWAAMVAAAANVAAQGIKNNPGGVLEAEGTQSCLIAGTPGPTSSPLVGLAATDTLELWAIQNSGVAEVAAGTGLSDATFIEAAELPTW